MDDRLFTSTPLNGTAAAVTSQNGCEDEFVGLTYKELATLADSLILRRKKLADRYKIGVNQKKSIMKRFNATGRKIVPKRFEKNPSDWEDYLSIGERIAVICDVQREAQAKDCTRGSCGCNAKGMCPKLANSDKRYYL